MSNLQFSVTKLRRHAQFNLLPGRVINLHLDPLSLAEIPIPFPELETLLLYGCLPGIYLENNLRTKQLTLESYVKNHLEQEVCGEALVRHLGSSAHFLEFAAVETGNPININKLSQELGVSRHTASEYFSSTLCTGQNLETSIIGSSPKTCFWPILSENWTFTDFVLCQEI